MTRPLTYTIVISDGDSELLREPLSHRLLQAVVAFYPTTVSDDFLLLASRHPSALVRETIARTDSFPEEVCAILAEDWSASVIRALVNSGTFREWATLDVLERVMQIDAEIAVAVAEYCGNFRQVNVSALATILSQHPDPAVALAIADNSSTPKSVLRTLLDHEDRSVVERAKKALR